MDLALNNLQRLICHKTQTNKKKTNKQKNPKQTIIERLYLDKLDNQEC